MEKYVNKNILDNEKILKEAKFSKLSILGNGTILVLCIIFLVGEIYIDSKLSITQTDIVILFILTIFYTISFYNSIASAFTSELALTNKRFIGQNGILIKKELNISLDEIDEVFIKEIPFIKRLFGYSTIVIKMTSGKYYSIDRILNVNDLKNELDSLKIVKIKENNNSNQIKNKWNKLTNNKKILIIITIICFAIIIFYLFRPLSPAPARLNTCNVYGVGTDTYKECCEKSYENGTDEYNECIKTNSTQSEEISQETIDNLINIIGAKDSSCYNLELNNYINTFAGKDLSNLANDEIYNLFLKYVDFNNLTQEDVEQKYCSDVEYGGYCKKFKISDYNDFLSKYAFNYDIDTLVNTKSNYYSAKKDNENLYLSGDGDICINSSKYNITSSYNVEDEIILSVEINISNNNENNITSTENYKYTFKKSTDDTKSEYYLIKVENESN